MPGNSRLVALASGLLCLMCASISCVRLSVAAIENQALQAVPRELTTKERLALEVYPNRWGEGFFVFAEREQRASSQPVIMAVMTTAAMAWLNQSTHAISQTAPVRVEIRNIRTTPGNLIEFDLVNHHSVPLTAWEFTIFAREGLTSAPVGGRVTDELTGLRTSSTGPIAAHGARAISWKNTVLNSEPYVEPTVVLDAAVFADGSAVGRQVSIDDIAQRRVDRHTELQEWIALLETVKTSRSGKAALQSLRQVAKARINSVQEHANIRDNLERAAARISADDIADQWLAVFAKGLAQDMAALDKGRRVHRLPLW